MSVVVTVVAFLSLKTFSLFGIPPVAVLLEAAFSPIEELQEMTTGS